VKEKENVREMMWIIERGRGRGKGDTPARVNHRRNPIIVEIVEMMSMGTIGYVRTRGRYVMVRQHVVVMAGIIMLAVPPPAVDCHNLRSWLDDGMLNHGRIGGLRKLVDVMSVKESRTTRCSTSVDKTLQHVILILSGTQSSHPVIVIDLLPPLRVITSLHNNKHVLLGP
jgi:hypothetical protein